MNALKIYNVVKTDNDLRKPRNKETYSVLGFMRLNGLIGETILPEDPVNEKSVAAKRELYDKNRETLDRIRSNYSLYLSRCSLEEYLFQEINYKLFEYIPTAFVIVIVYLQQEKKNHLVEIA